jgi:uncharacterized membrane protein
MFEQPKDFLTWFYSAEEVPFSEGNHKKRADAEQSINLEEMEFERRTKLSRSFWISMLFFVILAPITIFLGTKMEGRGYYFISLILVCYGLISFFLGYEGRKPRVREMVVLATMVALATAGRSAFYMVPNFKPVAAVVILSGIAFGAESGFLTGALSMLVSNFLFGQGPWTPWQMFAMGMIGFLAGVCYRPVWLRHGRMLLCLFGFGATLIVYGGIMNPASVFMSVYEVTWEGILASYLSGLPVDLVHAVSTAIFLWIGAKPLLEKLWRIKLKYDLTIM